MSWRGVFQVKWYHLLFGFLGIIAIATMIAWFFLSKESVANFVEDETDIVS